MTEVDIGTLHAVGDRWELRFERRFPHPAEKVWRALTDPEHLRHWFPADIEGEMSTGGEIRFVFRAGEGPTLGGRVIQADAPKLLVYTWATEEFRWELRPDAGGCLLRFTNTFDERGKAAKVGAGWHVCLDALRTLLDGAAEPVTQEAWDRVHPGYVAAFDETSRPE
jgi:uncharacterized protein YndB with AHSA1/START domain